MYACYMALSYTIALNIFHFPQKKIPSLKRRSLERTATFKPITQYAHYKFVGEERNELLFTERDLAKLSAHFRPQRA